MELTIAGLWRYPVKSLAGEPISEAIQTPVGIPGDRIVHVRGPEGLRTSRRQYKMLDLHGSLDDAGHARIGRRFGGKLALNAFVRRPGIVRAGDAVQLVG